MDIETIWLRFAQDIRAEGQTCFPNCLQVARVFYTMYSELPVVTPARAVWLAEETKSVRVMGLFLSMASAPLREGEDFSGVLNVFWHLGDKRHRQILICCLHNQLWLDPARVNLPSGAHPRAEFVTMMRKQRPRPRDGIMHNRIQQLERKAAAPTEVARVARTSQPPPGRQVVLLSGPYNPDNGVLTLSRRTVVAAPVEERKVPQIKIPAGISDTAAADDSKCVICLSSAAIVTLVPCGHLCLCAGCGRGVRGDFKCPLCRAAVELVLATFRS